MNKKATFLPLLLLCSYVSAQSLERSVVGSAGGTGRAGEVSMAFTVGETMTSTQHAGVFIVTQGFQQPDAIGKVANEKIVQVQWQIYPNPTRDWVELKLTSDRNAILQASVFDINGKNTGLAAQRAHLPGEVLLRFDLSQLAVGMYLIRLLDDSGKVAQTIRVQKMN